MSIKEVLEEIWIQDLLLQRSSMGSNFDSYRSLGRYRDYETSTNLIWTPAIQNNLLEIPDAIYNNYANDRVFSMLNRTFVFPINYFTWGTNYKGFVSFVRNMCRNTGVYHMKFNDVSYYCSPYIIFNDKFQPIFYSTTVFKAYSVDRHIIDKHIVYFTDHLFSGSGPLETTLAAHAVSVFTGTHPGGKIEVVCGRSQNLAFSTEPLDAFKDAADLTATFSSMLYDFADGLTDLSTNEQYIQLFRLGGQV